MNAVRKTPLSLVLAALLVLALQPAVAAEVPPSDPEQFRAELLAYVQDLSRLSPAVLNRVYKSEFSLAEAEMAIQSFTHEELRMMEQTASIMPFWRDVPQMLAEKSLSDPALDTPAAEVAIDAETLRAPMLAFVGALRQMPRELVGDEYHQRIDRVEATIQQLDAKQLVELQGAFNRQMPVWTEATSNRREGLRMEVQNHCGGQSFPSNVLCELDHVFNTIAGIPAQVATFASDAVSFIGNELKKLFSIIKEAIPTNPAAMLGLIGIAANTDWAALLGNIPTIDPPCPSSVPGIGEVGDIRAMYVCQRGPEFLGRAFFNIFPKDLWGMAPKIAAGLFYFPWTYLCGTCFAKQYEQNELQRVETHRQHLVDNLNVKASTRVDQTTVDNVQKQVDDLDEDVARVEGKVNVLTGKTDTQLTLLDVEVTTRASEASVDAARTDANDVLGDVAKAESKLDLIGSEVLALIGEQNETAASLDRFRLLAVRQRIEDDLIREATPDRIGLFELPEAYGGLLEMAMTIVQQTIASRTSAGVSMKNADREYLQAQNDYGNRRFKDAYTSLRKAYQSAILGTDK